jgi:hypothetical protein
MPKKRRFAEFILNAAEEYEGYAADPDEDDPEDDGDQEEQLD